MSHNTIYISNNVLYAVVCCLNKNIKTAWYSWKWMLRGLTGGLWTGRRRGKTPIIENTTVHSHSSTAGAIHSQQTHHHYGSGGLCLQQRGSANFYLRTRRTCGYFTWPCPHPISTDTQKKNPTIQLKKRCRFLMASSSSLGEGAMTTLWCLDQTSLTPSPPTWHRRAKMTVIYLCKIVVIGMNHDAAQHTTTAVGTNGHLVYKSHHKRHW